MSGLGFDGDGLEAKGVVPRDVARNGTPTLSSSQSVFSNAVLMHRIYVLLFPWYSTSLRLVCRAWERAWSGNAYPSLDAALKRERVELLSRIDKIQKQSLEVNFFDLIEGLVSLHVGLAVRCPPGKTLKNAACMTAYSMIYDVVTCGDIRFFPLVYAQGRVMMRRTLVLVRHTTLLTPEAPRGSDEHWERVAERFKQVTKKTFFRYYSYLQGCISRCPEAYSASGKPDLPALVELLLSEAKEREAAYLGAGGGDAGRAALCALDVAAAAQAEQAKLTAQTELKELEESLSSSLTWNFMNGQYDEAMSGMSDFTQGVIKWDELQGPNRDLHRAAKAKERETEAAAQVAAELVKLGFGRHYT